MTLYHKTFEATFVNGTFAHLARVAEELAEKAGIPVERVEIGADAWPTEVWGNGDADCEIKLRATRPMTEEEIAEEAAERRKRDQESAAQVIRAMNAQLSPEEIAYFSVPPAIEVTKP